MTEPHDSARELLGAWALDAVDDIERATVERAIATDPELAFEARQMRETVARLAESQADTPPDSVKEAVMAGITGPQAKFTPPRTAAQQPSSHRENHQSARPRWHVALAAAAAVVVGAAIPTAVAIQQSDRAQDAEQQAITAAEQRDALRDALATPGAQLVSEGLPGDGFALAVFTGESAVFSAEGMSELHEQDYQLWVIGEEGPVSAGVLTWHDGQLHAEVDDVPDGADLAVTAEPLGGSDEPTSDPLMVLSSS